MNERIDPAKLVAVPVPGDLTTYDALTDMELATHGLWRHILAYRSIPAHPAVADYREAAMARIKADIATLRGVLGNG